MAREKGTVKEVTEAELKKKLAEGGGGGGERRGGDRVPARLAVDVPLATVEQLRKVYSTNISKGGMLFSMTSPASMPAAVDLTLTLPDGEKLTLQSEVRHVARREGTADFDVGVQFIDVDEKTRQAFEDALVRLSKT
jgi:c-di-GMP-binding flagellar brake protein YcgR